MTIGKPHMPKRQRATVIVETPQGILLTRMRRGRWMLPGGGVESGEQPISAAIRELQEETTLRTLSAVFLFEHESAHYLHQVFHISAQGTPQPSNEIVELAGYRGAMQDAVSSSSVEIIEMFVRQKAASMVMRP